MQEAAAMKEEKKINILKYLRKKYCETMNGGSQKDGQQERKIDYNRRINTASTTGNQQELYKKIKDKKGEENYQ